MLKTTQFQFLYKKDQNFILFSDVQKNGLMKVGSIVPSRSFSRGFESEKQFAHAPKLCFDFV